MRILILSRGIPNKHDPQEGIFEWDQAKALKAAGHDVVVMSIDSRLRKYWRKPGITVRVIDGIKAYKLFIFPTSVIRHLLSFKTGVAIEAREARWLYEHVVRKEGTFDVVHAHFLTPIYYAADIKRKHDILLVGTEHWSKVNTPTPSKNVLYMAQRAYPLVDRLIAVSASLKKRLKDNLGVESVVVHNLIDTSNLLPLKLPRTTEVFRIVLVGSLIPLKGFDFFVRSFARSKLITEKVEVHIIGGGVEYDNLSNLINSLGLAEKVKLLGQQPRKHIFEELNKANLYVLSSKNETFSVSLIEALASGVPVIATVCGAITQCINSSNGLLVEVGNEDEMKNALEKIYNDYENYDAESIQKECLTNFSPESVSTRLSTIYNAVVAAVK